MVNKSKLKSLRGYRLSVSTTHLFPDIDGSFVISFPRQQIQVDEIFVHENYTVTGSKANDIALLRLGEKS